ncbi:MAG: hypothetical protein EOP53_26935 [Sphingobacteriales bacterium]|nr:MAG: hypothetical protein EOP53_26935 [Sphingobacteriales bacterium]
MKISKLILAPILAMGLMLSSCEKEETVSSNVAPVKQMSASAYESCETQCILTGSGDYYYKTGSLSGFIGKNTKGISYKVYNTETNFVVELSYNRLPLTSKSSSTIKVTVNGASQTNTMVNGGSATYTFALASGWKGCDETAWSIAETTWDGATAMSGSGTYNLIGICKTCNLVGNTFAGEVVTCGENREVVYTLSSEDGMSSFEMAGGLIQCVGTPVVTVTGGSSIVSELVKDGKSGNYKISVAGSLESCSTVKVRVNWSSDGKGTAITGGWHVGDLEVGALQCR